MKPRDRKFLKEENTMDKVNQVKEVSKSYSDGHKT